MIIDLSHRLEPDMPSFPGLPAPKFHTFLAHGDAARHANYGPGTSFQIGWYEVGNTGTYLDAPLHRWPEGADLADVPIERLVNLPGIRITAPEDGPIESRIFGEAAVRGKAVLVHTGWAKRWGSEGYFRSGPFLTASACEHLVHSGVALVGIDCANIDNMQDPARPAHSLLLKAGIPIVEHLRGLEEVPDGAFRFFAPPPAIRGGTSFPVRAFALTD